jgi:N-methylhydantoinase A/oxoprolinase/acetone carboxylase beta subunit
MKYLLVADTGGTFTDVVVHDSVGGRTEFGRRLTDYDNLAASVTEGLRDTSAPCRSISAIAAICRWCRVRCGLK